MARTSTIAVDLTGDGRGSGMFVFSKDGSSRFRALARVLPKDKRQIEKFWVEATLKVIMGSDADQCTVKINDHDDHAGPDIIIASKWENEIKVQVTELTSSFVRRRSARIERHRRTLVKQIAAAGINIEQPVRIEIALDSYNDNITYFDINLIRQLIESYKRDLSTDMEPRLVRVDDQAAVFRPFNLSRPADPRVQIAIYDHKVDDDDLYISAVKEIARKKAKSKVDWLLIWSTRMASEDADDPIVNALRAEFAGSIVKKVYFATSIDIEGLFEANIKVFSIKG